MRKVFRRPGRFGRDDGGRSLVDFFAFPFDRYFNPSHFTRPEVQRCMVDSDT